MFDLAFLEFVKPIDFFEYPQRTFTKMEPENESRLVTLLRKQTQNLPAFLSNILEDSKFVTNLSVNPNLSNCHDQLLKWTTSALNNELWALKGKLVKCNSNRVLYRISCSF